MLFVLFFFFKQKTAYEMRIRDWSSDVCSSDLRPPCPSISRAHDGSDPAMSHDHSHGHSHTPASFDRAFAIGIALNLGFVAIEAGYGFVADSVALLADAGHNLSGVLGLALAWGGDRTSAVDGKSAARRVHPRGRPHLNKQHTH